MSNNRTTREELEPSDQGRMRKLKASIRRRWNWLRATLLRKGRNTTMLWNFYATSHRNFRTSSSSTSSSGESIYFSASSDDDDDYGDSRDDGHCDNNHHQEDGPVSSRTRSRYGRLVAVVDGSAGARGGLIRSSAAATAPGDSYTHVKFAKTATLWRVRGFLNVESPVDVGLFDHSCRRMEELLAMRTAHSELQRKTFHTTSLAACEEGVRYRRGLATLVQRHEADWRHTQRICQEGEAAAAYWRSLGHRFWGYPLKRDQRLGAGYHSDGCYLEAAGRHGRAPPLYGGLRGEDSDEV